MNKSTLLFILGAALVFAGVIYYMTATIPRGGLGNQVEDTDQEEQDTEGEVGAPTVSEVNVYVVSLESGSLGCGDSVVPISRAIAPTQGVLQASLEELFNLPENEFGPDKEYYDALAASNLTVDSVSVNNGVASVEISGQLSIGGVCDEPRFVEQIRQTVLQFSTVDQAVITINGTPLGELFSSQG